MNVLVFGLYDNNKIHKLKFGLSQFLIVASNCVVNIIEIETRLPEYNVDIIAKNINLYTALLKDRACTSTMYFSKDDGATIEWVNKNRTTCCHKNIDTHEYPLSPITFRKIIKHLTISPIAEMNTIRGRKRYKSAYLFQK